MSLNVTHTNPHFIWVGRITLGIACLLHLRPLHTYLLSIGFSSYERHSFISLNKQILFLDLAQIPTLSGNFLIILSSPSHLFLQEPSSRDRYVRYLSKNNTEDASRFHKWLVYHYM